MGAMRRFTLVGLIATGVDISVYMLLVLLAGLDPWQGELVSVVIATAVSWTLHGAITFPSDPSERWYKAPGPYLSTAIGALVLGVTVVAALSFVFSNRGWVVVLAMKLVALGVAFFFRVGRYRETMFAAIRSEQSAPSNRPAPSGEYRLSVILPAFNEEDRIAATVAQVRSELTDFVDADDIEIVVVDDGSSDATSAHARNAGATQVLRQEVNRGKGAAVRVGVMAANGRTIAFTDADLAYAPAQIIGLMDQVEAGWDVVVGSRKHVDTRTVVKARRIRELGGRLINLLSAYVLLGRYRDTQCGLKAFHADCARMIFSRTRIDGFALDIEVFALVERYRFALLEVPVEVENTERSTVRVVRDALRLVADLVRIRSNGRAGLYEIDPVSTN